ncbi:MAG TPA: superoxide dismutase family protein [Thermoanaerobaculia bacterium]|nr:superoxide dismutase family protein [Thermoanaerobaculia bacterium]
MAPIVRLRSSTIVLLVLAAGLAFIWEPVRAQPPGGRGGRGGGGGRQEGGRASALAVLQAAPGGPQLEGSVLFYSRGGGDVQVIADFNGLAKPGLYALHVHEKGVCTIEAGGKPPFASAGNDFNPTSAPHACPDAAKRHAGDLGNVEIAADGTGHLELSTKLLALSGTGSVVDKAVILHAGADDCTTQPDGNAGAPLACGVAKAVDDTSSSRPSRRRGRTPPGTGSQQP